MISPGLTPELWALLPLATAAGLDLYLTIFFLGAAPHLGWESSDPGLLAGLQSAPVLTLAALLYGLEILAERSAPSALFWNVVHVVVRPLAAASLALLLLDAHPAPSRLGGAGAALVVALGVHAVRTGGTLVLWLSSARTRTRILASAVEDAMVLGLCVLALDAPLAGTGLAVVLLVGGLPQAPSYLDGFRFSLRATWGRTLGVLGAGRWFDPDSFPRWLRRAIDGTARIPGGALRGSPAAAFRLTGGRLFAHGWFVITGGSPLFVHRSWRGTRIVELDAVRATAVSEDFLHRRVKLVAEDGTRGRLHFPPDGPSSDRLRAEFRIEA